MCINPVGGGACQAPEFPFILCNHSTCMETHSYSHSPGSSSISSMAWMMPKRAQELGDIVGGIYPVCFWPLSPTITLLPV